MPFDTDVGIEDPGLGIQDPQITALLNRLKLILCNNAQVDARKQLMRQPPSEAQSLLDILQKLLDLSGLESSFCRSILLAIQQISSRSGLYPTCYELKDVVALDEYPVDFGGFADIFRGMYKDQTVCLKALRLRHDAEATNKRVLKELAKEALLWGQLSHPNVLMFYGLFRFQNRMCMVSPWMENSNVSDYLSRHPEAPRLQLVADVANGLSYLHSHKIIHGDLKGKNVLIDSSGRAHLADFGIASASDPEIVAWTTQTGGTGQGGTTPYQAPELLRVGDKDGDEENENVLQRNTMATDVYAWACVCYEVFAGKPPFYGSNPAILPLILAEGRRPKYPQPESKAWKEWGLTDDIWTWIECCWHQDYWKRPSAAEVIQYLNLLLPTGARPRPETVPVSPAQFRDRMGRGLQAIDVENLDRILCCVDPDPLAAVSNLIDGDLSMASMTASTDINEGLLMMPPLTGHSRLSLHGPENREAGALQFVNNGRKGDLVLLVIGSSGVGKTLFVDTLFGNYEGLQGNSNTDYIQCHYGTVQDRHLCIVDTPGFQDDTRTHPAILRQISEWLNESYPARMKVTGIICLQDITRITSTKRIKANMHSLLRLCGPDAAVQVIFVTTMWNKVFPKVGEHCESRLRDSLKDMLTDDSMLHRFDRTQDSALAVLKVVLSPNDLFIPNDLRGRSEFRMNIPKRIRNLFFACCCCRTDLTDGDQFSVPTQSASNDTRPSPMQRRPISTTVPSAVVKNIKIGIRDIILVVTGRVKHEVRRSFIQDALGNDQNHHVTSRGVAYMSMRDPTCKTRNIFLVYAAGFEDQKFNDGLRELRMWLLTFCNSKRKLNGLIYLEDYSIPVPSQVLHDSLNLLDKCVERQNIVVVTMDIGAKNMYDIPVPSQVLHDYRDLLDKRVEPGYTVTIVNNIMTNVHERNEELTQQWRSVADLDVTVLRLAWGQTSRESSHTSWDVVNLFLSGTEKAVTVPTAARDEEISEEVLSHGHGQGTSIAIDEEIVERRPEPLKPELEDGVVATIMLELQSALRKVDAYKRLVQLRSSDAQIVLDTLQKLLDFPGLSVHFQRTILVAIQRISAESGLWPACYLLEDVKLDGQRPVTAGRFADIYKGGFQGHIVCLKMLRLSMQNTALKSLAKEALIRGQLSHSNILAFYGLFRFRNQMCMVSPWMDNGDIRIFLIRHPSVSRLPLAADVANGLLYLHELGIVHGELKSPDVLIDSAGRARLTDFGLSSAADSNASSTVQSRGLPIGGATKWMAPELLEEDDLDEIRNNTTATDVYAWGCVCFEIFTSEFPFAGISLYRKLRGDVPKRPLASSKPWTEWGLTEGIWSLMENCWHRDSKERPSAAKIVQFLTPLLPATDTRPATGEMLPAEFRRGMGASLKAGDVEAFNRALSAVGIEFEIKEATRRDLTLKSAGPEKDPNKTSSSKGKEKLQSDQLLEDPRESDVVIAIVGPTGSGKSRFIQNLAFLTGDAEFSPNFSPRYTTTQIQHIIISHPTDQTRRVVLVDTPGFEDSYLSDSEILKRTATWIGQSYDTTTVTKFTGILYFHAMSQPRMLGTAQRNLDLLDKLMGGSATENIALVITVWADISAGSAVHREKQMHYHWRSLIEHGAKSYGFFSDVPSAWDILESILSQIAR